MLAIEILSPSTRLVDLSLKRARYEAVGCPSYWVVDPDTPSLSAWELAEGSYVPAGEATGDETYTATSP
jgi:Uma2 family endonuclease